MKYSLFLPLYNASKYLDNLISCLEEIKIMDDVEVVIVDSSSSDRTQEYLDNRALSYTVISSNTFDHGGTRSMAKTLCQNDIVVFLTQDALPLSSEDIKRLIFIFEDEAVGAAYGRQIPYEDTSMFGKHLREFNYSKTSYIRELDDKEQFGIKTAFLSNSFSAYRRSAMDQIGWFKDGLILGEDTYAGAKLLQAGYKLAYVADAQVYHSHDYTVFQEFKRYFDIGVFHKMESWILDEFGKPEGEGMKYIKSEFEYIMCHRAYLQIFSFFIRNTARFLGYRLGRNYEKLPTFFIKKFSMHYRWWCNCNHPLK